MIFQMTACSNLTSMNNEGVNFTAALHLYLYMLYIYCISCIYGYIYINLL